MTEKDDNADVCTDGATNVSRPTELPSEWTDVPADPDPIGDLEYELIEWEKISVVDDRDRVIFLPDAEEQLKDDAFIVSETSVVCDLSGQR